MTTVRMMAISRPCIEPVNRTVYRLLATDHGFAVHIVMPSGIRVGEGWKDCEAPTDEPFESTVLEPIGDHPRLQRLKGLEELVQRWQPTHIVVDNDPATMMVRQALHAANKMGTRCPKVWAMTAENLLPNYARDMLTGVRQGRPSLIFGSAITQWLRRSVRKELDCVFTLSADGTRALERMGFAGRVVQIPLGFDAKLFFPQQAEKIAQTRKRLGLHQKTIAYFGRLTPEKGLHLLLEALASIKDLPWQFLIDWFLDYESPYMATVKKQIASLGLLDRVVFFDATHAEIPDYMNAADFVVLASISTPKWKEQYGRVIPEAMACAKVVVGSDSGAIPEIIGDCGFVFPEGDVAALGDILRKLFHARNAELDPLREKARNRAQSLFSASRQAAIWAELAVQ